MNIFIGKIKCDILKKIIEILESKNIRLTDIILEQYSGDSIVVYTFGTINVHVGITDDRKEYIVYGFDDNDDMVESFYFFDKSMIDVCIEHITKALTDKNYIKYSANTKESSTVGMVVLDYDAWEIIKYRIPYYRNNYL